MPHSEEVSVVVPAYRQDDYLREALRSVFSDPGRRVELLVVDDAREASTAAVVAQFTDARYVPGPERGPAAARNLGLRLASSDLVAFLDHDDRLLPHGIQRRADLFDDETIVVLGAAQMFTGPENSVTGIQRAPVVVGCHSLMAECTIVTCSVAMVDRLAVLDAGGFDETVMGADDWDLWLRLAELGQFRTTFATVAEWRVGHASLSRSNPAHRHAMRTVIDRMADLHPGCDECRRLVRIAARRMRRHEATVAALIGGRRDRRRFVRNYPRAAVEWPLRRLTTALRSGADYVEDRL